MYKKRRCRTCVCVFMCELCIHRASIRLLLLLLYETKMCRIATICRICVLCPLSGNMWCRTTKFYYRVQYDLNTHHVVLVFLLAIVCLNAMCHAPYSIFSDKIWIKRVIVNTFIDVNYFTSMIFRQNDDDGGDFTYLMKHFTFDFAEISHMRTNFAIKHTYHCIVKILSYEL